MRCDEVFRGEGWREALSALLRSFLLGTAPSFDSLICFLLNCLPPNLTYERLPPQVISPSPLRSATPIWTSSASLSSSLIPFSLFSNRTILEAGWV